MLNRCVKDSNICDIRRKAAEQLSNASQIVDITYLQLLDG